MTKIFVSYRREDSADVTGRIGDRLRDQFGEEQIFTDVDNIPLGVDFRAHLDNEVSQCDVLLAVIGKDWLSAKNLDGELRLDDPADFVRIEIESALKRDIPVIPLLVRGASIPSSNQLPESIEDLAFRNAQPIRPDPDFKNDANRLVQGLLKHFEPDTPEMEETDLGAQESDHLQTLRHKMLVADDLIDLQRLRYEVEEHLHTAPKSPEARTLLQQISDAEDRQRSLDTKYVSAKNIPKNWQNSTPKVAALGTGLVAVLLTTVLIYKYERREPMLLPGPVADINASAGTKQTFITPDMVEIPAGSFLMGSYTDDRDEQPVHQVTVPAFELARNELTWAEWQQCENDGGCTEVDRPFFFKEVDVSIQLNHPVVNVNFSNVNEYLNWINGKTGLRYRLPSEAEWEYAARAGSASDYYWGDAIGENRANCDGCGSQWGSHSTAPVGSFEENPFELNDVHGNVWEWVADCWHGDYEGAPTDGTAWVDNCSDNESQLMRGGSWFNGPEVLRAANRNRNNTGNANDYVGFRLARTLP